MAKHFLPATPTFALEFARQAGSSGSMNKAEIVAGMRQEIGELEVLVKKLQARLEKSKQLVLDIEDEMEAAQTRAPEPESTFRKAIDRVFGETPKPRKK